MTASTRKQALFVAKTHLKVQMLHNLHLSKVEATFGLSKNHPSPSKRSDFFQWTPRRSFREEVFTPYPGPGVQRIGGFLLGGLEGSQNLDSGHLFVAACGNWKARKLRNKNCRVWGVCSSLISMHHLCKKEVKMVAMGQKMVARYTSRKSKFPQIDRWGNTHCYLKSPGNGYPLIRWFIEHLWSQPSSGFPPAGSSSDFGEGCVSVANPHVEDRPWPQNSPPATWSQITGKIKSFTLPLNKKDLWDITIHHVTFACFFLK